jgi:hypothetical protein
MLECPDGNDFRPSSTSRGFVGTHAGTPGDAHATLPSGQQRYKKSGLYPPIETLRRFVIAHPSDTETHRPAQALRISSQEEPVNAATDAMIPSGRNTPRNGSVQVGTETFEEARNG